MYINTHISVKGGGLNLKGWELEHGVIVLKQFQVDTLTTYFFMYYVDVEAIAIAGNL